jgi:twinkle protein
MSRIDFAAFGIDAPVGYGHGNKKCFCPKCHDERSNKRDKSLSIKLDTGEFLCHYCGWKGYAVVEDDWEKEQRREEWRREHGIPQRREKPVYKRPKPRPVTTMSDKVIAWFKSRGISEATVKSAKVTDGKAWMPQKNGEAYTVQFNYYLNNELINTKYRTGDKCFKLESGAELIPWNIDSIKGEKECVITEGEMDALTFLECGIKPVVSVPNGANANLSYLDDYIEDYFDDKDTIYIASDTDTKGVQLRDELLRRFGRERCRVLTYGESCKDANEHLMKYGKDSLLECLHNAPENKADGVFTVSDFELSLDNMWEKGWQKGCTIGHENFDRICSFETKRLCIVTGIPSSGKSEFIDEMAERLNIRYGWRFGYFSPENAPLEYHAAKLIEKFTGKRFSKATLPPHEYADVKQHLEQDFFFISPKDFKLDTILNRAKYLVRRRGIKCLVIDPYNRLENEQGSLNETQYVSKVLDKLMNFAQQNDVLVILMAHPVKIQKNKDGVFEVPTLYDISGSANFYNKADFGIVVHRNRVENTVEVHVQKVKFRNLGEGGTALFQYNLTNGRYSPYTAGTETKWDNDNHLWKKRQEQAENAEKNAVFDFQEPQQDYIGDPFAAPLDDDECPF